MIGMKDFKEKKIIIVNSTMKEHISFKNDNLVVLDENNNIKFQISCYKIFALFVIGGMTITTGIIQKSKKFGFSIIFFSAYFKIYEIINFKMEGNTVLRRIQYSDRNGKEIAKNIVINKIENQIEIIRKLRIDKNNEGIEIIEKNLNKLKLNTEFTNYEIMGIEGVCSKVYFKRLYDDVVEWKGRQPRLKRDKINLLLDIGYTILFNYIEAIVNLYGFDIYKGNLHQEFYKRKSLICDIIEPFRMIVDYSCRKMLNLKMIQDSIFYYKNNQYYIEPKENIKIVVAFLNEINMYNECIFKYIQKYYRWYMKNEEIEKFPKVRLIKNDSD